MVDFYTLDREVVYNQKMFRIIQILDSGMLLVVEKEVFDKGDFPLPTFIIPGE